VPEYEYYPIHGFKQDFVLSVSPGDMVSLGRQNQKYEHFGIITTAKSEVFLTSLRELLQQMMEEKVLKSLRELSQQMMEVNLTSSDTHTRKFVEECAKRNEEKVFWKSLRESSQKMMEVNLTSSDTHTRKFVEECAKRNVSSNLYIVHLNGKGPGISNQISSSGSKIGWVTCELFILFSLRNATISLKSTNLTVKLLPKFKLLLKLMLEKTLGLAE